MGVIAFVHPDLGIGGAERLICDAALALQLQGHEVKIYTAHHDSGHCFKETKDGTLNVVAVGDWLPRHILWKCYALWAYIRMIYVSFYLVFFSTIDADVIICDQVSACIPVLKLCKKSKIIFYCHFPDLLLTSRKSFLKKMYRIPLDWLEEFTTGLADVILVNSNFTAKTFHETFTSLFTVRPVVLYPSLNFETFTKIDESNKRKYALADIIPPHAEYVFLSINRYERKKNLALALNSLRKLKDECTSSTWKKVHLVMAGGYDDRVEENKTHYIELESLAAKLAVKDNVTFMRSFSDEEKVALLSSATSLLYTPSNEHFGIVPIESMFMKCPVVACKSGGPLETVKHEETGFLCDPTADDFSRAMMLFIGNEDLKLRMGNAGHKRVVEKFSFDAFKSNLDNTVKELCEIEAPDRTKERLLFVAACFLFCAVILFRFIFIGFIYKLFFE